MTAHDPDQAIRDFEIMAAKASDLLAAMANPKRLMVLCSLLEAESPVGTLARRVGLAPSALSQHLARMRLLGLVATRRDGQTIHYRLASEEVRQVLKTLHALYCAGVEPPEPPEPTAN